MIHQRRLWFRRARKAINSAREWQRREVYWKVRCGWRGADARLEGTETACAQAYCKTLHCPTSKLEHAILLRWVRRLREHRG